MNLGVTGIINNYHVFDREFWLSYKTLEKLHPEFQDIKLKLLKAKRVEDKYLEGIDKLQFDTERALLEAEWKEKNEQAKADGIATHEYIEGLFKSNLQAVKSQFQIDTDLYQVQQAEAFKTAEGIFVEHRLEIPLDETFTLVGIPDCFIIHDGVVDIIDWKTSDESIKFKSIFEAGKGHTKKMKYPLSSLDDCQGVHYQLQLSIYLWMILKLRPELQPGSLKIVWIQNNQIKKTYTVEYLGKILEKLIPWHVKNIKLNKALLDCREIIY